MQNAFLMIDIKKAWKTQTPANPCALQPDSSRSHGANPGTHRSPSQNGLPGHCQDGCLPADHHHERTRWFESPSRGQVCKEKVGGWDGQRFQEDPRWIHQSRLCRAQQTPNPHPTGRVDKSSRFSTRGPI